jgi:Protein of unknown function (DUF3300)
MCFSTLPIEQHADNGVKAMTTKSMQRKFRGWQSVIAFLCALLLAPGDTMLYSQTAPQQDASAGQAAMKIPDAQLDSLVAPIALYPDPLLSQVLVASTYPLEIIQLQQWLSKHKDLKDKALTEAVQKEAWDPSIQAMSALPDAVKQLADNIKWTTDLGNAFLAQQADVMDAVQRMRTKAKNAGNLKSTEQQKVETQTVENKTVVVIQQANPQIVYVPSYNPVVVYGPPVYPYPPIYYPPPSYYAAGVAIAFGVGIAIGAAYHGGWGYNCGWGHHHVTVNVNNNYVSHYNRTNINNVNRNQVNHYNSTNINNVNRNNINNVNRSNNNTWQHNAQHRGGAPYSNKAIATQYGGTTRGDSLTTRQNNARLQQVGTRPQPSGATRGTAADRAASNAGARPTNTSMNRSGGGNNIGDRQVPSSNTSQRASAFAGASSKASAQASSARGSSSLGGSRSGGARAGGGRNR